MRRRARLRDTGSSAAATTGSTGSVLTSLSAVMFSVPPLLADDADGDDDEDGDESISMLAAKRAKRWVSGCGAVDWGYWCGLLAELLLPPAEKAEETDEGEREDVSVEVERERKEEAEEARLGRLAWLWRSCACC